MTTVSECFGLDEWMTCLILQVSAPSLHQLLACDLVQNLVYLVQLHHCTKVRYAYGSYRYFYAASGILHYCGQMAGWMKTPLGTEVDLGAGRIVLDGFPAFRERGTAPPPL